MMSFKVACDRTYGQIIHVQIFVQNIKYRSVDSISRLLYVSSYGYAETFDTVLIEGAFGSVSFLRFLLRLAFHEVTFH